VQLRLLPQTRMLTFIHRSSL